ncbi:hypothetical protein OOZ15_07770, partial [Galbibacter sp. EGI 63066]|nr:hypothetical protein [Galbibacter sp. EGI 63066]
MKRIVIFLFFQFIVLVSWAQVGVGTPLPNPSSQLEVVASDKGVLIPRLALINSTDATTIANGNVESLLVYNTATVADVTPGYHYWDGAKWVRLANIDDIVASNETVTLLTDNGDGTYTYVSEDGTITVIDVPASVVNQFEQVLNEGPVTIDGNTYNTFEEYLEQLVAGNETVTT